MGKTLYSAIVKITKSYTKYLSEDINNITIDKKPKPHQTEFWELYKGMAPERLKEFVSELEQKLKAYNSNSLLQKVLDNELMSLESFTSQLGEAIGGLQIGVFVPKMKGARVHNEKLEPLYELLPSAKSLKKGLDYLLIGNLIGGSLIGAAMFSAGFALISKLDPNALDIGASTTIAYLLLIIAETGLGAAFSSGVREAILEARAIDMAIQLVAASYQEKLLQASPL